jgi:predicted CXXCH cytochrome family protein
MLRNSSGRAFAAVLGVGLAVAALPVCPQIDKSRHNLKITGPGADRVSDPEEICVFCHTPIGLDASAMAPHWNRALPSPATYQTYDTGTSTLTGKVAPVGSVSLVCLSCHDGAQAMNAVINASQRGWVQASRGGTYLSASRQLTGFSSSLGTDLRDDHPVGVQYGGGGITASSPTAATNDPDYRSPQSAVLNNTRVWWIGTGAAASGTRRKTDLALYTRTSADGYSGQLDAEPFVECASCHDPHTDQALFLRISNAHSALCLSCHMK